MKSGMFINGADPARQADKRVKGGRGGQKERERLRREFDRVALGDREC